MVQFGRRYAVGAAAVACVMRAAMGQAGGAGGQNAVLMRDATAQMKTLQTNLKLAQESAGPAGQAIPASRGRLAATRLASAKDAAAQVQARLEKLPAEDAETKALKAQYDAAMTEIAALETRLANPGATSGAGPALPAVDPANRGAAAVAPAGTPAGTRLDYRQEQALKDAKFFLTELQGYAEAVAAVAATAEKAADKQTLDHRTINDATTTMATADKRVASINTRLADLPADGAGVPEVAGELKKQVASLEASKKVLAPVQEMFAKALNPATYPELDADMKRLQELSQMFSVPEEFASNPQRAMLTYAHTRMANEEAARIGKKYALLVDQKTDVGVKLEGMEKHFATTMSTFSAAAKKETEELPKSLDAELAKIDQMVKEAVDEKKPAFFTNGILDQMARAKTRFDLLVVLSPEQSKGYEAKLAASAARVKQAEGALTEAIIQANEMAPDRFRGSDRERLVQLAVDTCKKENPGAVVLATRIPSPAWEREVYWRYQNGTWTKTDHSTLQVQVILKRDEKIAEVRPVNFSMDHMQGDTVSGYLLYPKSETLGPGSLLLVSKVK